jgi:hypothetical protein
LVAVSLIIAARATCCGYSLGGNSRFSIEVIGFVDGGFSMQANSVILGGFERVRT